MAYNGSHGRGEYQNYYNQWWNQSASSFWAAEDDQDKVAKKEEIEKHREKIIVPGLSGLKNIGNTCYMNSVLQCLNNIKTLSAYMREKNYSKRLKNNGRDESESISDALSNLLIEMWEMNRRITPRIFKMRIGEACPIFAGYDQNDSQELLNFVLDSLHEEQRSRVMVEFCSVPDNVKKIIIRREKCIGIIKNMNIKLEDRKIALAEYKKYCEEHPDDLVVLQSYIYCKRYIGDNHSIVRDLFSGLYYSRVTCGICNNVTNSFEPFTTFPVSVDQDSDTSLEECLAQFSKTELLTGDNMYSCTVCGTKTTSMKEMYIWEAPEVLVIHFKRFKNTAYNIQTKIKTLIKFPMEGLTLENNYSDLHPGNDVYDLQCVSEHYGSCHSGHYIAHCKNPINDKWYKYDDARVFHVPDDEIEKEITTEQAYLLFYVKRRSLENLHN